MVDIPKDVDIAEVFKNLQETNEHLDDLKKILAKFLSGKIEYNIIKETR
jgi:predicted CoA-binding protein